MKSLFGWTLLIAISTNLYANEGAEGDFAPHIDCVAEAVLHEAIGEGVKGMVAVAQVIKKRTEMNFYPSTPCAVVKQSKVVYGKRVCQFSYRCDNIKVFREDYWNLAKSITECVWDGECVVNRALDASIYYACDGPNKISPPNWDWTKLKFRGKIFNHCFYQEILG